MSIIKMATSTVQAIPKLYDVIMWLMGRVEKFPRSQKFTLGDRIVNICVQCCMASRTGTSSESGFTGFFDLYTISD